MVIFTDDDVKYGDLINVDVKNYYELEFNEYKNDYKLFDNMRIM